MFLSPKLDTINGLRLKLADYQVKLDQVKELKTNLNAMLSSYNAITDEDKNRLDKVIPEKFNNVAFAADINGIAFRDSMTVKSITILDQASGGVDTASGYPDKSYRTVTSIFTLVGQYEQFTKFLRDLESSLRLIDVRSITIKESSKSGLSLFYEFSVEMDTYHLR